MHWVDSRGALLAVPAPFDAAKATVVATLTVRAAGNQPIPVTAVAMAVDVNGDLLVLHHGSGLGTPDPPRIVTVALGGATPTVTDRALTTVVEPMSLLVRPDGSLVVGDGGPQEPATADDLHGNLVAVDRSTTGGLEREGPPAGRQPARRTHRRRRDRRRWPSSSSTWDSSRSRPRVTRSSGPSPTPRPCTGSTSARPRR